VNRRIGWTPSRSRSPRKYDADPINGVDHPDVVGTVVCARHERVARPLHRLVWIRDPPDAAVESVDRSKRRIADSF